LNGSISFGSESQFSSVEIIRSRWV